MDSHAQNHFNLLRWVAAYLVLIAHSFALTGAAAPLIPLLHKEIGRFAVDIFFIVSGYLVTASLLRRQSLVDFFKARFLRIYPALWVMLILTVIVLGLFFSSFSFYDFISQHQTHVYLAKCATLISNVSYSLPGVFEHLPYANKVNGSLWTLPYEIKLYLCVALFWFLVRLIQQKPSRFFLHLLTCAWLASLFLQDTQFLTATSFASVDFFVSQFPALFFTGSLCYALKKSIPWSRYYFCAALLLLFLSSINFIGHSALYTLSLSYCVLYLALIPKGKLLHFNRVGDYSYGIYIYAFPVQQCCVAVMPKINPLMLFFSSSAITLMLAVLSWHFIERPWLDKK